MLFALGVILMVIAIGASIALHEIGHLIPAKKFGVRVPQYMVGFGPTLWSRQRGETEYGVKAIPLGGYIRMIGMYPPKPGQAPGTMRTASTGRFSQLADEARAMSFEEVRPGDDGRMFYQLPARKKITIMLGGPLMNLLIAIAIFTGIFTLHGIAVTTPTLSAVSECVDTARVEQQTANECTPSMPKAPANEAGLRPGDTIVSINGTSVETWADVRGEIRANLNRPLRLEIERDGARQEVTANPIVTELPVIDDDGRYVTDSRGQYLTEQAGFLGATGTLEIQKQPITAVPGLFGGMVKDTFSLVLRIPEKMVGVYQAAFGGAERDPEGPMSVVGVGRVAGEVASSDLFGDAGQRMVMLISLVGSLNLMLFAFNMLPLLPLDGGHVAGAIWESVKRGWARGRGRPDPGPVDVAKALPLAYGVAIAFIAMTVLLMYADIVSPVRLT